MVNNNSYFYISGFISISLFIFFASLIVFMMFTSSKVDIFALKKDNYISISIELPKIQTTTKKKSVVIPIVQESVVESKEVNIDDLFSDVWTKKIKKIKKDKPKVDNKRLQEIGRKSKKIDKKSVKPIVEKVNSNNAIQKSDDSQKDSTANEVNEYLAKIQALVYENFNPPPNSQGYSVKAVIELSSIGKVMDFRILNYSTSSSLNDECDKIKQRLMGVLFPINPQKKSFTTIVNIRSDKN